MISNANDGRRLEQEGPRCLLPVLFVLVVMVVAAVVMVMVVEVEGDQRLVVERRQQGLLVVLGEGPVDSVGQSTTTRQTLDCTYRATDPL